MTTASTDTIATPPKDDDTPFENCLIDASCAIREVVIGSRTFRLRSVTAGEDADISVACRRESPIPTGANGTFTVRDLYDMERMSLLTVAAALGAYEKIGDEGWSGNEPVTLANVKRLAPSVVVRLASEHGNFFRADKFGAFES